MPTTKLNIINNGDTVLLSRKCPWCGKEVHKEMNAKEFYDGIEALNNKVLLQDAFPNADADTREFIWTGICNECWNTLD